MPLIISFPHLDDLLGHSIIYGEYKGDYAKATRVAEEQLNLARGQGDSTCLADALLARAVVYLLSGESRGALACLDQIDPLVQGDPTRRYRTLNYHRLVTWLHFGFSPDDGSNWTGSDVQRRWDGVAFNSKNDSQQNALVKDVPEYAPHLEQFLIVYLLVGPRLVRDRWAPRGFESSVENREADDKELSELDFFYRTTHPFTEGAGLRAYTDLVAAGLYQLDRNHNEGRACQFLDRALTAYTVLGDDAGAATCRMTQADWYVAPYSTPTVWNHAIRDAEHGNALSASTEAAENDRTGVDLARAKALYSEAERLFERGGAKRGLAAIQLRLGYIAVLENRYDDAVEHASRAVMGFEQAGDLLGVCLARAHLCLTLVCARRFAEAAEPAEAIGVWGREQGSFSFCLGLGTLLARDGRRWLVHEGDLERSLACSQLAETVFRQLGADISLARNRIDQCLIYRIAGEQGAAAEACEEAWSIYTRIDTEGPVNSRGPDPFTSWLRLADTGLEFSGIYYDQLDADGMEKTGKRLDETASRCPKPTSAEEPQECDERVALCQLLQMQAASARFMSAVQRAVMAEGCADEGEVRRLYDHALEATRLLSWDSAEAAAMAEASVLAYQRRYAEAYAAVQALERNSALGRVVAASLKLVTSDGQAGELQALIQRKWDEQMALLFTGLRAWAEAKKHLDALEENDGEEWWKLSMRPWLALTVYGLVYEGLEQRDQAADLFEKAVTELETRRERLSRDDLKTGLAGDWSAQSLYFSATRYSLKLWTEATGRGDTSSSGTHAAQAFAYAERGKARALLDLMASTVAAGLLTGMANQDMRQWRRLNAQISTWRGLLAQERTRPIPDGDRIRHLEERMNSNATALGKAEAQLERSDPAFFHAVNPQARVLSLDEVQSLLPPGTALLQYYFLPDYFTADELLAWAMTHDQGMVRIHRANVDIRKLSRNIRAFHRACAGHAPLDPVGSELATALLGPFREVLGAYPSLIIVPYGAAHLLPFQALPWEGEPLIANHTLSYLPSTSALQYLRRLSEEKLPDRILTVGNPMSMSYRTPLGDRTIAQPPLPASASEAAYVASLFARGQALTGSQAAKSTVCEQMVNYPLLHFATHGYLSETDPLISSILLANGESLTLQEMMGMRLDADLIVLSACRTGLGKTTGGDDVLGLARGILSAGARAALVSLWPVDDDSTSLLMGAFYRRAQAGDDLATALAGAQNELRCLDPDLIRDRKAELRLKVGNLGPDGSSSGMVSTRDLIPVSLPEEAEGYRHPAYWAPFILIGFQAPRLATSPVESTRLDAASLGTVVFEARAR